MREAYPQKLEPEPKKRGHSHSNLTKSVVLRTSTAEEEKPQVVIDPGQLKPSNFAVKDLEKLKQKRYELKTIEV